MTIYARVGSSAAVGCDEGRNISGVRIMSDKKQDSHSVADRFGGKILNDAREASKHLGQQGGKVGTANDISAPNQDEAARQEAWRIAVKRLDATYSIGGRDALAKMNFAEVHILCAEKMVDLDAANTLLAKNPSNEFTRIWKEKIAREVKDISGYISEIERQNKDRGTER
jgi:hypothetical protein